MEIAVAALLIEAARSMDARSDRAEKSVIERLLAEKFDLVPDAVAALVLAAEKVVAHSAQYFPLRSKSARI